MIFGKEGDLPCLSLNSLLAHESFLKFQIKGFFPVKMQVLGISLVFQGLLPMQRVWVRSLIGELRSDMLHRQKIKMENRNNIITNSVKTFKMVHI